MQLYGDTVKKINLSELKFTFIRSPGPGGQNVNKVATGVQLRFNVLTSNSLSEETRARILLSFRNKVTSKGEIIIKATRYRTQDRNKQDALERLEAMISRASVVPKKRKKTKPSKASTERRLTKKKLHGKVKSLRSKNLDEY